MDRVRVVHQRGLGSRDGAPGLVFDPLTRPLLVHAAGVDDEPQELVGLDRALAEVVEGVDEGL